MDDLIYNFLIQSGYPRASIVLNVDLLGPTAQVGSGMKVPTFVIVDPDTADLLAVVEVVDAVDMESLKQGAVETGAYASRLAGKFIQGFVIRVDVDGVAVADQVQFYRIWPNSTLQQLSSKNFPDLDSLKVARKLAVNTSVKELESVSSVGGTLVGADEHAPDVDDATPTVKVGGAGLYVPAFMLLMLALADGMLAWLKGAPFISVPQSIMALGAAVLLTLPAAIRYLRRADS